MTCITERTNRIRTAALAFAVALVCALFGIAALDAPFAYASTDDDVSLLWTEKTDPFFKHVYLKPGDRYNVGRTSHLNTHIHIDESGTYTLYGSSEVTSVHIEAGGVTVYLENGLNIDPGAGLNSGYGASAILVEPTKGDVTLVSKAGATVRLGGYWGNPSINKIYEGSKLIFKTEDPSNPGHIICDRSSYKTGNAVAIGGQRGKGNYLANLRFESGKVTAKGSGKAAGIGSAVEGDDDYNRSVRDVVITGTAEVVATGGSGGGPGIGSANMDTTGVTIEGGAKVTATGTGGSPGIGSGSGGNACAGKSVSVAISGGTVTARGGSGAPGIGSAGANATVAISGGTVTAQGGSGAPGIGTGGACSGTASISISGGTVNAKGGSSATEPAIGTTSASCTADIAISGGTVSANPGTIGTPEKADYGASKVVITGGSVRSSSWIARPDAVNSNGDRVHAAMVYLDNVKSGSATHLIIAGLKGYQYGEKDLQLIDGCLPLWLPSGSNVEGVAVSDGSLYTGTIVVGESSRSGTLYLGNNIILDGDDVGTDGSARTSLGATQLSNVTEPIADGYVITGYRSADGMLRVRADTHAFTYYGNNLYIDPVTLEWAYQGFDYPVTLYATWAPISYGIRFDANVPAEADASQLTGQMPEMNGLTYGAGFPLEENQFALPGYRFVGWSTEPAGGFAEYDDGEMITGEDFVAGTDAGPYTLYAQWEATHDMSLGDSEEAAGASYTKSAVVDPQTVAPGTVVNVALEPAEGYGIFSVEAADEAGVPVSILVNEDGTCSFTMPDSSVTVQATFKLILPFDDLGWDHWAFDDIALAYQRSLMTGYSDSVFGPDDTTTRAMAATVIWRLAGSPSSSGAQLFADDGGDMWYTEAIRWAGDAGITTGYGDTGLFGPDDELTREQIAVMLMRYADYQGIDTSARADLSSFPDAADVSPWARDAVEWAVAENLLRGDGATGRIDPQAGGTRAHLATLVMRYALM